MRLHPQRTALAALGALALALFLAWGKTETMPPLPPPLDRAAVLDAFASPDPDRVRAALQRIREARPAPTQWLVGLLRHPNRGIREWSAHALGDLAPRDPEVVRALVAAFEDEDDYVRWKAARALGNIGPLSAAALPLLERSASTDQEVEIVRATAMKAVEQIRSSP